MDSRQIRKMEEKGEYILDGDCVIYCPIPDGVKIVSNDGDLTIHDHVGNDVTFNCANSTPSNEKMVAFHKDIGKRVTVKCQSGISLHFYGHSIGGSSKLSTVDAGINVSKNIQCIGDNREFCTLETVSGAIIARDIAQNICLQTESGSINCDHVKRGSELRSNSGKLYCKSIEAGASHDLPGAKVIGNLTVAGPIHVGAVVDAVFVANHVGPPPKQMSIGSPVRINIYGGIYANQSVFFHGNSQKASDVTNALVRHEVDRTIDLDFVYDAESTPGCCC